MTSDLDLRGVWVPLITPFDATGAVDVGAIERLTAEYLAAGAAGIVALGTTGEASALENDEKAAVVGAIAKVCNDAGSRVIVGTGTNNTKHTIEATKALGGHAPRRRRARCGAVLRAAVGSRDRRAHEGGRERKPRADRRSTTFRRARAAAWARRRCWSWPTRGTSRV